MTRESVVEAVRDAVAQALRADRGTVDSYGPEASLVDHLAFDSLAFVNLAVALEDRLGVSEFPMQSWADQEKAGAAPRFTLGSLLTTCERVVSAQQQSR